MIDFNSLSCDVFLQRNTVRNVWRVSIQIVSKETGTLVREFISKEFDSEKEAEMEAKSVISDIENTIGRFTAVEKDTQFLN